MVTENRPDLNDIRGGDWVDSLVAPAIRPYLRLARVDRPVPVLLTLLPCWAAMVQAAQGLPIVVDIIVFTLGAFLMRSAGCTVNDIADRNFDGHVERTRFRPLPSGQISLNKALIFLVAQLLIASLLLIFLTPTARYFAVAVVPLVIIYPFCKRFTHWPQAILGAAFNWGMLVAWAHIEGNVPLGAWLMWLGALIWQIGYDTVYAYVDVEDDSRLGLKSTANLFQSQGKKAIAVCYVVAVLLWSIGGWLMGMSALYTIVMLAVCGQFGFQVWRVDLARPEINYKLFIGNVVIGILLVVAALLGTV